jgi:hypothetical protein
MSGFLSVSRFSAGTTTTAELSPLLALLAGSRGFRRGHVAVGTDDPGEVLLVTEWDGAGWWRRALSPVEVRAVAVPLLGRSRPEAASFDVVDSR